MDAGAWSVDDSGLQSTIPIEVSERDFASGGINARARDIDTDHDGSISKKEFLAYLERRYDGMKKTDGMVPVDEMATPFARDNIPPGH